jgi:putative transposase
MRVNKLFHCSYSLSYHFVFVTKYRRKCFTGAMLNRLKEVVAKLCADWEAELIEMNDEVDRVHFLLGLNSKCAPSVLANNLKTVTSRLLRKEFPALRAKFNEPVLWSRS